MTSVPFIFAVELVRVIDGDTVILDIDLGFHTWRRGERYRLARINAPELSTPEGPPARDHLISLLGTPLHATTFKADNYGRYLVELSVEGRNLNDMMVTDGFAVRYP
jgi:micrococcal nuclease